MSNRTLAICIALGLAVVGVTWWIYSLGPLVLLLAVLMLVCPAIGIWVMRTQRGPDARPGTQDRNATPR